MPQKDDKKSSKKSPKKTVPVDAGVDAVAAVVAVSPKEVVKLADATTSKAKKAWKIPSEHQLFIELNENNDFFDMLVDMIPKKLYIQHTNNDDDDDNENVKYHKNAPKDTATSKEARKAFAKLSKRRKLDPHCKTTTVQTIMEIENEKKKQRMDASLLPTPKNNHRNNKRKEEEIENAASNNDDENHLTTGNNGGTKSIRAKVQTPEFKSRIEELRMKLQDKIHKARSEANRPDDIKDSKRRKRLEDKMKRREEAFKNNKSKNSSSSNHATESYSTTTTADSSTTNAIISPDPSTDLMNVDYGILGGLTNNNKNLNNTNNYTELNKSLGNITKKKNLHKMLSDAQNKKEMIQQLSTSKNPQDVAKMAQIKWSDAYKDADGVRTTTADPSKIKKLIAKKASAKKKSQKSWKSRIEQQTSSMNERQVIRKHNIETRKQGGSIGANLSSKRIVEDETTAAATKKGRKGPYAAATNATKPSSTSGGSGDPKSSKNSGNKSRPGFEGGRQGFINSGGIRIPKS